MAVVIDNGGMQITTSSKHDYYYLPRTNEIIAEPKEDNFEWIFNELSAFGELPNVDNFVISITENCNLRCTYCCYSGKYKNNRIHGTKSMSADDIDAIYEFIKRTVKSKDLKIAFYGGEPLTNLPLLKYAIEKASVFFQNFNLSVSISTNGVLLTPYTIDWLIKRNVRIDISIDGHKQIHDRQRINVTGNGSFDYVYKALSYIKQQQSQYLKENVLLLMTLTSLSDLETIARHWAKDEILCNLVPTKISSLAPNFKVGVTECDYEELVEKYLELLSCYERHRDWVVLQVFFEQCIAYWINRPILDASDSIPMSTCLPISNKLYVDADMKIGVCEKMADCYRIGNVCNGIDWKEANIIVSSYYKKRKYKCRKCPAVRMCNLCLTAVEYNDSQWNTLCHNEKVFMKIGFRIFCEMAERGLINSEFPTLKTRRLKLTEVTDKDCLKLTEIINDKETNLFLPELIGICDAPKGVQNMVNTFKKYQNQGEGYLWGLRLDKALIGFVGVIDLSYKPSIFYALHPKARHKGYMQESVLAIMNYLFRNNMCNQLSTEVKSGNTPSIKLLEKVGFVKLESSREIIRYESIFK